MDCVGRLMTLRRPGRRALRVFAMAGSLVALVAGTALAQVKPTYLYGLSTFSGPLRLEGSRLHVDQERGETYVIYQNIVRVFNRSGMEIFSFGDGLDLGQIADVAVDPNGDVILLSYKDSRSILTRCTFRGVPIGPIEIKNLPPGVEFAASRMVHRSGLFYFASLGTSSVIVTDASGEFRKHIEFLPMLEDEDRKKGGGAEMIGFTADQDGNMFFTIPTLFKVFKYSSEGKLTSFGRSGSAPGRFGVIAGVATDSHGNLLVTDKLKCVVMVFDKDFNFVTEFGYRGARPENLIVPDDIAVDGQDRLYVSQGRRRGTSVFALARD